MQQRPTPGDDRRLQIYLIINHFEPGALPQGQAMGVYVAVCPQRRNSRISHTLIQKYQRKSVLMETAPRNIQEIPDQSSFGDLKTRSHSQCQPQSECQSECDYTEKKDVSNASPPRDPEAGEKRRKKKPLSFFLAFVSLLLMVFLVSLDATTLAVTIPVIIYTLLCVKRCFS